MDFSSHRTFYTNINNSECYKVAELSGFVKYKPEYAVKAEAHEGGHMTPYPIQQKSSQLSHLTMQLIGTCHSANSNFSDQLSSVSGG